MTKTVKKISIRFFTYVQLTILALFAVVTVFTLTRLSDVHSSLETLSLTTVPAITDASLINQKVEKLVWLTVSLTNASNQPTRRLISQQLDNALTELNATGLSTDKSNEFIYTQIAALTQELKELDELVDQRLRMTEKLAQDELLFHSKSQTLLLNQGSNSEEAQKRLTEILFMASLVTQNTRIHELRQLEDQLNRDIQRMVTDVKLTPQSEGMLREISVLMLGTEGILNQKIEALRIEGRARGRGNFVKNLVSDVASNLEHRTKLIFKQVKRDALTTESRVHLQSQIGLMAGIIVVALTLLMIYVLHRRIVDRLISLTTQIDEAAKEKRERVIMDGNDEISHLANTFSIYIERVKQQEIALVNMSLTDPLTGIPNRRAFDQQLDAQIAMASRERWPLSLLLIDIDYFKKFNDYYGHKEGDTCLKTVASKLHELVQRNTDFCARYGGEEFVCILPNTDEEGTKIKAEELRAAIEDLYLEHKANPDNNTVTISVGAATFPFTAHRIWSHDFVVENTDTALYKAKDGGRNRIAHIAVS